MIYKYKILSFLVLFQTFILVIGSEISGEESEDHEDKDSDLFNMDLNVSNVGAHLREMIEHFKISDPVGLPGAPIPDPMPIPDMKYSKFGVNLLLEKNKIYGLSQFRIEEIRVNLYTLEVDILLTYQKLEVLGTYTAKSFLSRSNGNCNVTIIDVSMGGTAKLQTTLDGHLEASQIDMDLVFENVNMDFENPSYLVNILQGMMNAIGTFVFNQAKFYVLREVNSNVKENMNQVLRSLDNTFPNSISPLDLGIAKGRKFVRDEGYDPFPVNDYKHSTGLLTLNVREIELTGLASFYRLGNMSVLIKKNTVSVEAHLSTQKLEGKCAWEATVASLFSTYGSTDFSVQYIQVRTRVNQSLDLRNNPTLEELDVTVGNIQLRMDGMGTIDYALEFLVNVLPNILRHAIVNAVEGLIKQRIQTALSSIDVEELVVQNFVSKFDQKLKTPIEVIEDDDLINLYDLDLQPYYDEINE